MRIGPEILTPEISHGMHSHDECWPHLLGRRQDDVSLSTSKAEFVAASQAGQEAIYLLSATA